MESLLELFVHLDDFCQAFLPKLEQQLLTEGTIRCKRARSLSLSEGIIILIHFHLFYSARIWAASFRAWSVTLASLISFSGKCSGTKSIFYVD